MSCELFPERELERKTELVRLTACVDGPAVPGVLGVHTMLGIERIRVGAVRTVRAHGRGGTGAALNANTVGEDIPEFGHELGDACLGVGGSEEMGMWGW